MNTPIPNKLKEVRLQKGLKQIDVAIWLSLQCENRICRWEKGMALPSVENLFKLAQIYEVLPHELYPELFASKAVAEQKLQKNLP